MISWKILHISQQNQQDSSSSYQQQQQQVSLPATLKKNIKMFKEAEWKDVTEKKDVLFRDATSPFCGKKATYYQTFIPRATIEDVAAVIDDDPKGDNPKANAYTYDRLLTKRILVDEEDEGGFHYIVWRTLYKSRS